MGWGGVAGWGSRYQVAGAITTTRGHIIPGDTWKLELIVR